MTVLSNTAHKPCFVLNVIHLIVWVLPFFIIFFVCKFSTKCSLMQMYVSLYLKGTVRSGTIELPPLVFYIWDYWVLYFCYLWCYMHTHHCSFSMLKNCILSQISKHVMANLILLYWLILWCTCCNSVFWFCMILPHCKGIIMLHCLKIGKKPITKQVQNKIVW